MSVIPVEAIAASVQAEAPLRGGGPRATNFSNVIDGLQAVNRKVLDAEASARAFAVDDSVPVHQVTYALEQARMSVELMLQVRSHLVQGYQELLRMQL